MKWKDKSIAKLILKKSNSYLKIAIVLFLLTLMLPVFFVIYMINEQNEQKNNYMDNENIHMIRLDGKILEGNYHLLTNQEEKKIRAILDDKGYQNGYESVSLFKLVGLSERDDDCGIEVFGISKEGAKWIVREKMEDNIFYMEDCNKQQIDVSVPIIKKVEDGVEVGECKQMNFSVSGSVKEESPLLLYMHKFSDLQQAYVSDDTFLEILKKMYKLDEKINSLYAKEIEENVIVEDVYIYVKDVYQIDKVADELKKNGYCATYTFEAFDSLSASLAKTNVLLAGLMILVLIISTVNLIVSFWSYLKLQQKDMGILLFYGYTKKRLYKIYCRNISRIFYSIGGVSIVLSTLIWIPLMKGDSNNILLFIMGAIAVITLAVRRIVFWGPLRKYLNRDFIYLIKKSKEFE